MAIVKPINVAPRVCVEIAKNFVMKVPAIRRIRTGIGRTSGPPLKENLQRYVYELIDKIERHSSGIKGKSILEVGPGDHLATGLALLALGAKSYSVLDRFPGDYKSDTSLKWYKLLRENWKFTSWPEYLNIDDWLTSEKVTIYKTSAEDFRPPNKFDIVCSYAVGEHISDLKSFANLNKNCIAENGIGIHCIDFSGHQWDLYGDPFLFLKFPDFVWELMGSARGEPNRVRFAPYLRYFNDANLHTEATDIKHFNFNGSDDWVANKMDDSFLVQEATVLLTDVTQHAL